MDNFQDYWYSIGGVWILGCSKISGYWAIGDDSNGIEIRNTHNPDCVNVKIFVNDVTVLDSTSDFDNVFQWLQDNLCQGYDWDTIISNFPN